MTTPLPLLDARPPGASTAPGPESLEHAAALFKTLGDPVRLRLLLAVAAAEDTLCVCHLPDVGVSQPTVSHHLRRLREAGLIESERRGTWVHYRMTDHGRQVVALARGALGAPGAPEVAARS